jgi:hypothetical protein
MSYNPIANIDLFLQFSVGRSFNKFLRQNDGIIH